MTCTRCDGTGFLNLEQAPEHISDAGVDVTLAWLQTPEGAATDVCICDCCGDGSGWYGDPGQHYSAADPAGKSGPYSYNGGLCECH